MIKSAFKQAAVLFLLPVLFLSQCKEVKPVHYSCENGDRFSVVVRSDGDRLKLSYQNKQVDLHRKPAASGAKYSNAKITYWSKGAEAILIIDDKIVCRGYQTGTVKFGVDF